MSTMAIVGVVLGAGLPLLNLGFSALLAYLHVKNATAIATGGTTLVGDAVAAAHGQWLAALPKILTDASTEAAAVVAAVPATATTVPTVRTINVPLAK